jgi:hypothetical protein
VLAALLHLPIRETGAPARRAASVRLGSQPA